MKNQPETWKRIRSETVADARVFTVRKDFCQRDSDGTESTFFVVENPDWVNVIALTKDGNVILIEQFRHGAEEVILEIPGGMVDEGENHTVTAARELLEETGYAPSEVIGLGMAHPNPAIQNNAVYFYLALDCEFRQEPHFDTTEHVVTRLVPLEEIKNLIESEQITHSLVLDSFLRFFLRQNEILKTR